MAEEALQFLILLVDVNELFDKALGVYDFDLVLFVAERSQKDPKEFLPFLNELKSYPEAYRKFKIDKHLKRPESALKHIYEQCIVDPSYNDECLALVQDQRLYKAALALFKDGSDMYHTVNVAGETLVLNKNFSSIRLKKWKIGFVPA